MEKVSLCTYSTGQKMVRAVLEDWRRFAGPAIGEVVVAVSSQGDPPQVYRQLEDEGVIDRLIVIPANGRSVNDIDTVGIVACLQAAKCDYALLTKLDTLPHRDGNENWLAEALGKIRKQNLWGMTGSFRPDQARPLDDRYSLTRQFSNNFALLKPADYIDAVRDHCGDWVLDPQSPSSTELGFDRFDTERAVDLWLEKQDRDLLYREEQPDWTVFHVNVWGDTLERVRERFLKRRGIAKYLNRSELSYGPYQWQNYYSHPKPNLVKRTRVHVGAWRRAITQSS